MENNYNYLLIKNSLKHFKKLNLTKVITSLMKKWIEGELSNFDYLCLLNKYSGRTYHDLNQYPVFPWILSDYVNPFNLDDKKNFRNLSYAMTLQNEEKRNKTIEYYDNDYASKNNFQVHFSIHYIN